MDRRAYLAAVGTAAGLTGCLGLGPTSDAYDVGMTAQAFRPREVVVETGDRVVWRNTSTRAHSVTAYENGIPNGASYFATGGFDTEATAREAWNRNRGVVTTDEEYARRFEIPGTYAYFCIPHEEARMVGTVTVES